MAAISTRSVEASTLRFVFGSLETIRHRQFYQSQNRTMIHRCRQGILHAANRWNRLNCGGVAARWRSRADEGGIQMTSRAGGVIQTGAAVVRRCHRAAQSPWPILLAREDVLGEAISEVVSLP